MEHKSLNRNTRHSILKDLISEYEKNKGFETYSKYRKLTIQKDCIPNNGLLANIEWVLSALGFNYYTQNNFYSSEEKNEPVDFSDNVVLNQLMALLVKCTRSAFC